MNTNHNPNKLKQAADIVTWSVLLGKWTSFAQSALALPDNEHGGRLRASVAPIIGLQALCFALGECAALPIGERLLGIDRAGVGIRGFARDLDLIWRAEQMPADLLQLLDDAGRALVYAEHLGFVSCVQSDGFVMPEIHSACADAVERGFEGDLFAALPGTLLAPGEPALFTRPHKIPFDVPGLEAEEGASVQVQVYRSIDESRSTVVDEIVPFHTALPAGRPLLDHVIADGELTLPAPDEARAAHWIEQQARAFDGRAHEIVRASDETTGSA